MFKDQPVGTSGTRIVFNNTTVTNTNWTESEGKYRQPSNLNPALAGIKFVIGGTSSVAAKIHLNKDGKFLSSVDVGTTVSATFRIAEKGSYTFSIASADDAAGQVVLTNGS